MIQHEDQLAREAERLHRALFGGSAPGALVERYAALHRSRPIGRGAALEVDVARILASGLDLEAVELALRWRERDNSLTRKLHALCYLAEVRAPYFDRFVGRRGGAWLPAVASLAWQTARSAWKLAKGLWLARRHRVL